jgi:hypothetical protein
MSAAASPATNFFSIQPGGTLESLSSPEKITEFFVNGLNEQHDLWIARLKTPGPGVPVVCLPTWEEAHKFIKNYFHERYPAAVKEILKRSDGVGAATVVCRFAFRGIIPEDELAAGFDVLLEGDEIDKIHTRYTRKVLSHTPICVSNYAFRKCETDPKRDMTFCSFSAGFLVAKK